MSKIKVRFKKIYSYIGNQPNSQCICELSCYLPTETDSNELALILRSPKELLGWTLSSVWGKTTKDSQWQVRSRHIYGQSWSDLNDKVERVIKETINTLKEVIAVNKAALLEQPEDCEVEYTLVV